MLKKTKWKHFDCHLRSSVSELLRVLENIYYTFIYASRTPIIQHYQNGTMYIEIKVIFDVKKCIKPGLEELFICSVLL